VLAESVTMKEGEFALNIEIMVIIVVLNIVIMVTMPAQNGERTVVIGSLVI
jgi:hypothetical protein